VGIFFFHNLTAIFLSDDNYEPDAHLSSFISRSTASFTLHLVLQVGKLADLVLWKPSFFGAKPEMVIKGGDIAWANMGDANASIPTPEPVIFSYVLTLDVKLSMAH